MSLAELLVLSLGVAIGYMVCIWLASLRLRNASIVDVFWGLGFVLVAVVVFAFTEGFLGRKILIVTLVTVWGVRLSLYILWRNWGKGEDYRYRSWREQAGARFWWISIFRVFLLQGVVLWLVSMPVLAAQFYGSPDRFTVVDLAGVLVSCRSASSSSLSGTSNWPSSRRILSKTAGSCVADSGATRVTPITSAMPPFGGDTSLWQRLRSAGFGRFSARF